MTEAYFHWHSLRTWRALEDEWGREYEMHQSQKKNSPHSSSANNNYPDGGHGHTNREAHERAHNEAVRSIETRMSHAEEKVMLMCGGGLSCPSHFKRCRPGPSGLSNTQVNGDVSPASTPTCHGSIHLAQRIQKSRPWATFLTSNLINPTTLPPPCPDEHPSPSASHHPGQTGAAMLPNWLAGWLPGWLWMFCWRKGCVEGKQREGGRDVFSSVS